MTLFRRNVEQMTHRFTPVMRTGKGTIRNYITAHAKIIARAKKRPVPVSVAAQPSILPCLRQEAVAKYVPPELLQDDEMAAGIAEFFQGSARDGYVTFFTMDGLRHLIFQGKIMEMIGPDIPVFDREDILDALEELIRRAKTGSIVPYMFREEVFRGFTRISLGLYGTVLFVCCDIPSRSLVFNDITEATLARVLKDYSENALQLGDVFSPEETIRILEHEVRLSRKRLNESATSP